MPWWEQPTRRWCIMGGGEVPWLSSLRAVHILSVVNKAADILSRTRPLLWKWRLHTDVFSQTVQAHLFISAETTHHPGWYSLMGQGRQFLKRARQLLYVQFINCGHQGGTYPRFNITHWGSIQAYFGCTFTRFYRVDVTHPDPFCDAALMSMTEQGF